MISFKLFCPIWSCRFRQFSIRSHCAQPRSSREITIATPIIEAARLLFLCPSKPRSHHFTTNSNWSLLLSQAVRFYNMFTRWSQMNEGTMKCERGQADAIKDQIRGRISSIPKNTSSETKLLEAAGTRHPEGMGSLSHARAGHFIHLAV